MLLLEIFVWMAYGMFAIAGVALLLDLCLPQRHQRIPTDRPHRSTLQKEQLMEANM
jgi:heme exporter protein D